jgi:molybdate/tungstate transport system substrate-binding protein
LIIILKRGAESMQRKSLVAIGIIVVIIIAIALLYIHNTSKRELLIFSAGSLSIPLNNAISKYEAGHRIDIRVEYSGSVEAVKKITDLHRTPDILFVADYNLIPRYLMPDYTGWYIGFATNQLVIVFTDKSSHHDIMEQHPNEWYKVLMMNDVKWGFSDPDKDPCGYRAVGVIGLASIYYNDSSILKRLILDNTNIEASWNGSNLTLRVPAALSVSSRNLIVRSKSVDLISMVEAGLLDYAFEYKSVAVQHGLKYVELPPSIDLGHTEYAGFYKKVNVRILVGTPREAEITLQPIIYGVTIPSRAPHYKDAVSFLAYILKGEGRRIFMDSGLNLLSKPILVGSVPVELEKTLGE